MLELQPDGWPDIRKARHTVAEQIVAIGRTDRHHQVLIAISIEIHERSAVLVFRIKRVGPGCAVRNIRECSITVVEPHPGYIAVIADEQVWIAIRVHVTPGGAKRFRCVARQARGIGGVVERDLRGGQTGQAQRSSSLGDQDAC